MKMKRYAPQLKESIVRKKMPPENVPIMQWQEKGKGKRKMIENE